MLLVHILQEALSSWWGWGGRTVDRLNEYIQILLVNNFGFPWVYSVPLLPSSPCPEVSLFEQWTWWGRVSPAKGTQWTSSIHRSLRGSSRWHCSALKKKPHEVDWALGCQQPLGEVSEVRFHLSSRYCPTSASSNWWHICTPNCLHI